MPAMGSGKLPAIGGGYPSAHVGYGFDGSADGGEIAADGEQVGGGVVGGSQRFECRGESAEPTEGSPTVAAVLENCKKQSFGPGVIRVRRVRMKPAGTGNDVADEFDHGQIFRRLCGAIGRISKGGTHPQGIPIEGRKIDREVAIVEGVVAANDRTHGTEILEIRQQDKIGQAAGGDPAEFLVEVVVSGGIDGGHLDGGYGWNTGGHDLSQGLVDEAAAGNEPGRGAVHGEHEAAGIRMHFGDGLGQSGHIRTKGTVAEHGPESEAQAVDNFRGSDGFMTGGDPGGGDGVQLFIRRAGGVTVGAFAERAGACDSVESARIGAPDFGPAGEVGRARHIRMREQRLETIERKVGGFFRYCDWESRRTSQR